MHLGRIKLFSFLYCNVFLLHLTKDAADIPYVIYVVFFFSFLQAFCGPLVLYPKLLSRRFSLARLKVYHATFGLACYVLASTTLALGLNSDWARVQFPAFIRYCFITCPIICALVVTNQVTNGYLMRKRMQM